MAKSRSVLSVLRASVVCVGGTLALSGCLGSLVDDADLQKFGGIVVKGTSNSPTELAASATAIFFRAYSATIPNSRSQANSCQFSSVDTVTRDPVGQLQAGQSLTMRIGNSVNSRTTTLPFENAKLRYASGGSSNYVAGDSATIEIPGATSVFPAAVVKIRLAEPLTVSDVTVPAVGTPLTVTWNASADTTTAIFIALKYANPSSSPYANEQVLCSLRDDGSEDILTGSLSAFYASPVSSRSLVVTRWRTTTVAPDDKTLIHIVSSVDTPAILK
ncbi:MAG: hypothetical protein H7Z40_21085 [Phycisphaerae bacterium]|nr:hypothetical protein [Gemmatimonadaceae bacterium]